MGNEWDVAYIELNEVYVNIQQQGNVIYYFGNTTPDKDLIKDKFKDRRIVYFLYSGPGPDRHLPPAFFEEKLNKP